MALIERPSKETDRQLQHVGPAAKVGSWARHVDIICVLWPRSAVQPLRTARTSLRRTCASYRQANAAGLTCFACAAHRTQPAIYKGLLRSGSDIFLTILQAAGARAVGLACDMPADEMKRM